MSGVVLVLEDDLAIGELILGVLREEGLKPLMAANGEQALDFLARCTPDLILADVHVPGPVALEDVALAAHGVPLLVMSASREGGRSETLGAYAFVSKPFDLLELVAEVRRGLELRALARS